MTFYGILLATIRRPRGEIIKHHAGFLKKDVKLALLFVRTIGIWGIHLSLREIINTRNNLHRYNQTL
jgi:hypothetical protein